VSATLEPLLTAKALSDLLCVSANTVLDWFQSGRIPGYKLHSGAVRFRESEIVEWLEGQRA
jgi:excisionase family DNA binding protein